MTRNVPQLLATLTEPEIARLNVPMDAACHDDVKKFRSAVRKIANVKSAQNSRKRRSELILTMQQEIAHLKRENAALSA
mgnify:CR=1 FL=1